MGQEEQPERPGWFGWAMVAVWLALTALAFWFLVGPGFHPGPIEAPTTVFIPR